MPTLLDEMVIRLGIDGRDFQNQVQQTRASLGQVGAVARRESSKLEDELKKVHVETGRRMQQVGEVGRQVGQQLSSVKSSVLGVLGAVAGAYGLQQFVSNLVGADAALGNFSKALGLNVEDVATWIEMGKSVGSSAESMKTAIASLSQIKQDFLMKGTSPTLPVWNMMGINPKNKNEFELMKEISEWVKNHPPAMARAVLKDIGFGPDTIPLLAKGRVELEKLEVVKRSLGVATAKSAEEDQNFLNKLNEIKQAIQNIGRVILSEFHEPLMQSLIALRDWVALNQKDIVKTIGDAVREAIPAIKAFGAGVLEVVDFLGGWKRTTEIIFGLWIGAKVVRVISAVAAIASGMWGLARATTAVDVAAAGAGVKTLLGLGALGAGATAVNWLLEKLEEQVYGKEYVERGRNFRDQHSPLRDWVYRQMGVGGGNAQEFHDKTYADIKTEAERRNLPHPEVIASLGAAQASVESTNGTSDLAMRSNNLFGIKPGTPGGVGESGRSGDYVAFASREAAAKGYVDFITKNQRYSGVLSATSVPDAAKALAGAGYAEDPNYQAAIADRYRRYGGIRTAPDIPKPGPVFGSQMQVGQTPPVPPAPQAPPVPPAPQAPPTLPVPPLPPPPAAVSNSQNTDNSRTSSIETNINGPITVHTAATDAEGIARGIGGALQRYNYVPHMNVGLA